jgi:hypothetical protein
MNIYTSLPNYCYLLHRNLTAQYLAYNFTTITLTSYHTSKMSGQLRTGYIQFVYHSGREREIVGEAVGLKPVYNVVHSLGNARSPSHTSLYASEHFADMSQLKVISVIVYRQNVSINCRCSHWPVS